MYLGGARGAMKSAAAACHDAPASAGADKDAGFSPDRQPASGNRLQATGLRQAASGKPRQACAGAIAM
jgi:hypothetical protein